MGSRSDARGVALPQRAVARVPHEGEEAADGRVAWGLDRVPFEREVGGPVGCGRHEEPRDRLGLERGDDRHTRLVRASLPSRHLIADVVETAARCYEETSTPYPLSSPPTHLTPQTFTTLHSLSPLRHASSVTAPTLLVIGEADRRVPKDQGRAWFHALRGARKAECEMLVFPGNGHPVAETVECVRSVPSSLS